MRILTCTCVVCTNHTHELIVQTTQNSSLNSATCYCRSAQIEYLHHSAPHASTSTLRHASLSQTLSRRKFGTVTKSPIRPKHYKIEAIHAWKPKLKKTTENALVQSQPCKTGTKSGLPETDNFYANRHQRNSQSSSSTPRPKQLNDGTTKRKADQDQDQESAFPQFGQQRRRRVCYCCKYRLTLRGPRSGSSSLNVTPASLATCSNRSGWKRTCGKCCSA